MKSANCSSTTGRSPIQAAPIAAPTNPSSAIGVSMTPLGAELLPQALRHAEGAAEMTDVLAEQEDALVFLERVSERRADRLEVGDLVGRAHPEAFRHTLITVS